MLDQWEPGELRGSRRVLRAAEGAVPSADSPMIVLGERHLKRILSSYLDYYHSAETHLSLEQDAPGGRVVQSIEKGVGWLS